MTYDSNEDALKFYQQSNLTIPILRDTESVYINALGILNETVDVDHWAYGIPHPGIYLVDRSGVIRAKFAEESYKERPLIDDVLAAANGVLSNSQ